ncbi:hypothetical protein BC827DRAFT_832795 [Russula dissimulans]|nr:hypothetical protein BC827DRAFT_832795 [Russula dissimulans]
MFLSFSIPTSLLLVPHQPALDSDGYVIMVTPEQTAMAKVETTDPGCLLCGRMRATREYRLVRDWERIACGIKLRLLGPLLGAVVGFLARLKPTLVGLVDVLLLRYTPLPLSGARRPMYFRR